MSFCSCFDKGEVSVLPFLTPCAPNKSDRPAADDNDDQQGVDACYRAAAAAGLEPRRCEGLRKLGMFGDGEWG